MSDSEETNSVASNNDEEFVEENQEENSEGSEGSDNTGKSEKAEEEPLLPNQVRLVQAILQDHENNVRQKILVCGLGEESQHLLKIKNQPIFPLSFYREGATLQQMDQDLQESLGSGKTKYHWKNSTKREALMFVTYETVIGYGCKHYVTNAQFKCATCSKFFGCPYCHEASFDFSEEPHPFVVDGVVRCSKCENQQNLAEKCEKCQSELYKMACGLCGFSSLTIQFFHCEQCKKCIEGDQTQFKHCEKCGTCVHKLQQDNHDSICGHAQTEVCQICQSGFDAMFQKRYPLVCGHDMHQTCLYNLKQNNRENTCPTCRMPAQTKTENAAEYHKFISLYAMTEVPQWRIGEYVNVSCLKCKKEFVKNWHPKGYICPYCDSVNCTENGKFENAEEGAKLVQEQYKHIRDVRKQIPIYPLVLFPKENYEEMAEMIQDYVDKYEAFWKEARTRVTSPFEMPLREMVNAYCLVRDIDDHVGYAALNLCHARKFFPDQEHLIELAYEAARSMAEVKEVKRLGLDK